MTEATNWIHDPLAFAGRVETRPFDSEVLRGNCLGDPAKRCVPVYLPPGADSGERFPVVFLLVGFMGRGYDALNTHPWKRGPVARFDEKVAAGECPPAILVLPDCFTKLGGSQYVDSSTVGRYETYVTQELTRFIDETYPTRPGRRGVIGKSSGGFAAMHLSMRHPETFPVAASISGDCHFEYCYALDFLNALRGLIPFDGDPARFLEEFHANPKLDDHHAVINFLAMAACYSPSATEKLGFELPIDLRTGARKQEVWERWLEFDPVHACERYAENMKQLELLYLECGKKDEFHLQFGLRVLTDRLKELGVPFEHEEFDGGHFDINYRYVEVLPRLIEALR